MNAVKAKDQLGMSLSTARSKLVADILFSFIEKHSIKCWRCGNDMSRGDYTIEHKTPWLGADNARELYFDLQNISFSHDSCNKGAARKYRKHGTPYTRCHCDECKKAWNAYKRNKYTPEDRHAKYMRTGC